MDLSNLKIDFTAKIKPIKALNENFTLCRCYVLALGKNRNMSNITKDAVEKAIPTLFNSPVVANLYEDENGGLHVGGHDLVLEKGNDGKCKFKMLTIPYGVVPESANLAYEEVEGADGTKNTYLASDIILWTRRSPELLESIYNEDVYWGQSMEIEIKSISRNKEDKNYMDINDFSFHALCLLGKSDDKEFHVEPCFPNAVVKPKTLDNYDFSQQFKQMKEELAICFSNQNIKKEEEQVEKDKEIEPQAKDTENVTEKGLEKNKDTEVKSDENDVSEEHEESPPKQVEEFALTYKEKIEAVDNELSKLGLTSDELSVYYHLCDMDDKFIYVEECKADQEGFSCTKGRFVYEFSEGDISIDAKSFEPMFVKWLTKAEVDELDKLREDFAVLAAYKAENEAAIKMQKFEAIISEFSDLEDDEDFINLTKDIGKFESEEALKEKLFALRGKKVSFAARPDSKQSFKIPVKLEEKSEKDDPYGYFFEKYLNK